MFMESDNVKSENVQVVQQVTLSAVSPYTVSVSTVASAMVIVAYSFIVKEVSLQHCKWDESID